MLWMVEMERDDGTRLSLGVSYREGELDVQPQHEGVYGCALRAGGMAGQGVLAADLKAPYPPRQGRMSDGTAAAFDDAACAAIRAALPRYAREGERVVHVREFPGRDARPGAAGANNVKEN